MQVSCALCFLFKVGTSEGSAPWQNFEYIFICRGSSNLDLLAESPSALENIHVLQLNMYYHLWRWKLHRIMQKLDVSQFLCAFLFFFSCQIENPWRTIKTMFYIFVNVLVVLTIRVYFFRMVLNCVLFLERF